RERGLQGARRKGKGHENLAPTGQNNPVWRGSWLAQRRDTVRQRLGLAEVEERTCRKGKGLRQNAPEQSQACRVVRKCRSPVAPTRRTDDASCQRFFSFVRASTCGESVRSSPTGQLASLGQRLSLFVSSWCNRSRRERRAPVI